MIYTIGEIAAKLQLPTSTLRFYDKQGLLPFVERSESGIRIFKESDFAVLQVITCLKKTGMPLKDIRNFIEMSVQGDATIAQRLTLIDHQRETVRKQIAELEQTLRVLEYKHWYYQTALEAGTTAVPEGIPEAEIPEALRCTCKKLHHPE